MIKESLLANETHVDALQRDFFNIVANFGVFGPILPLVGSKEYPKGGHKVYHSYSDTAAILTTFL